MTSQVAVQADGHQEPPAAGEEPPSKPNLNRGIASAAIAEAVSYGVANIIRLGSNLVLTRLLMPEAFGLMALSYTVIFTLWLLSEVGLSQAVIMSPRGEDPKFVDTVWTLGVIRGGLLWLGTCVLAWPMQYIMREPRLLWIVPVLGFSAFIHGFGSPRTLLLRRHLRPVPVMINGIAGLVAGSAANIIGAYFGLAVTALLGGALATAVVELVGSHILPGSTYRPRLRIDPDCRKEILSFGKWFFWSSVLLALSQRADQLLLGRLLGATQVGVYQIGLTLSEIPESLAGNVIGHVVYPAISRAMNEAPERFAATYYGVRRWLDPMAHILLGGLFALSDWLVNLLYPDRYAGASAILRVLAVRSSLNMVGQICEQAFYAHGASKYGFRRNMAVSATTLVALPIGAYFSGLEGVLWGSVVARAAALVVLWPAAYKMGFLWLRRELLVPMFFGTGYLIGRAVEPLFVSVVSYFK